MAILNAIATVIAMLTFVGIVWWAWSRGREKDNREAAMLPFDLPDESPNAGSSEADSPAGDATESAVTKKHNGGSHE